MALYKAMSYQLSHLSIYLLYLLYLFLAISAIGPTFECRHIINLHRKFSQTVEQ